MPSLQETMTGPRELPHNPSAAVRVLQAMNREMQTKALRQARHLAYLRAPRPFRNPRSTGIFGNRLSMRARRPWLGQALTSSIRPSQLASRM